MNTKIQVSKWLSIVAMGLMVMLTGCAVKPQLPVALGQESLIKPDVRIGVAMTAIPKADTSFPGAGCLLCLATASVANSGLTAHVVTLPVDDMAKVKTQLLSLLQKKGAKVVAVNEALNIEALPDFKAGGPNVALKDFKSLASKYQIDKLIVVDVQAIGVHRNYSAYIPTSDPKAVVIGRGYVVNLSNNAYEWFLPFNVQKAAEGKWDEAPKFPGLTNAYFQSIEEAKDILTAPLR
ncbi:hypothetical protein [Paucibacter sp. Y2R2-4]|uniref:hypothetical protein n=1 Tax=Paucibacter sp. Y2R2-4 TaxID=2893553 RepID=UPI0021E3C5B0|nr:hypothetical protein [Paucibacter sp. Y2R2-4]MCV2350555.1 hypothetical protein [Paucibacter sp. Y2R2-4]